MRRIVLMCVMLVLARASAHAAGRVLDGAPVAIVTAQTWCPSPLAPLPNWDGPAHPDCTMIWGVLAERGDRILYSARYAWPSPARSDQPLRVLSEVLYEGVRGSKVVRKLYAVQDDEAHVRLAPLRVLTIDGASVIESQICMTGTNECGRELAVWTDRGVEAVKDSTVADIRAKLPKDYDLRANPSVDLAKLTGSGKVWAKRDADCCPSAAIEFKLRLEARELRVSDLSFERRPA